MFTLLSTATHEQEIKHSRFLAVAGPVVDEQAARNFVTEHSIAGANHNCWAWRIGQTYRFSDDGEPGGTAGKPILQAIGGHDLDGIAVVVTRWFGGILLGSGGLVRAYGGTAALCLQDAAKVRIVPAEEITMGVSFSDLALLKARLLAYPDVHLTDESFTHTGAVLTLSLPQADLEDIFAMVRDLTSGRVSIGRQT